MPRATGMNWYGQAMVRKSSRKTITRAYVLKPKLLSAIGALGLVSTERLSEQLIAILQDHATWRRQEGLALSRAANNAQLTKVGDLAERVAAAGDGGSRALHHRLMGFLQNLGGDAGFALGLALGRESACWAEPDLDVFGPAAIAKAAGACTDRRTGRAVDKTLGCTLARLVALYEQETARDFTHSPHKDSVYAAAPQSHGGVFVAAVIGVIDPGVQGSTLCNHLARLQASRNAESSIAPGATGGRGTNSLIIEPL